MFAGVLVKRIIPMLRGMATIEMTSIIPIQVPIPESPSALNLRVYCVIELILIVTSNRLVKKEKRGARGIAAAKNTINPS